MPSPGTWGVDLGTYANCAIRYNYKVQISKHHTTPHNKTHINHCSTYVFETVFVGKKQVASAMFPPINALTRPDESFDMSSLL
jgi:hypothetical protein